MSDAIVSAAEPKCLPAYSEITPSAVADGSVMNRM